MQVADDDIAALIARYARVASESNSDVRAMGKCALLDKLGEAAPHSDEALTVIAAALADEDGYEAGASPYDAWYEIVAEHAYRALLPIAARAEGVVVAQLEQSLRREDDAVRRHEATPWERIRNHTGVRCREYAAILLNHISTLSPSAIDALMRCASDPSHKVQQAVGQALRGRVDVSMLLANPETRLVGLIAGPALTASQAVQLLRDESVYVQLVALQHLRRISPAPREAAMPLIECLNDQSDQVVHGAANALEGLALDDMAVTEALFEAGRKGSDRRRRYEAMRVLAHRPAAHLVLLMPNVLAWFLSSEEDNAQLAAAVDAVGDLVPLETERVLKEQLAALSGDIHRLRAALRALRGLSRMARLVRPQIEAMRRHPDAVVRSAVATLAAALQPLGNDSL
jgi:hypothetical protein